MNDGFPQLKFENAMVIEKLFENIRKEMAPKTQRVTFDSFIELVNSFSTSDIDKKIDRFFNLIDEDGTEIFASCFLKELAEELDSKLKENSVYTVKGGQL